MVITSPIAEGYFNKRSQYAAACGDLSADLVSEALEMNPNNTFAQKMQGKLDSGKNLSVRQFYRLAQQNETAIIAKDISKIQRAAEASLTELGETGDVDTIAAALAKQAAGERLTRAEKQAIADSEFGQQVADELNPEKIRARGSASGWAQHIDTEWVNTAATGTKPAVYSMTSSAVSSSSLV